MSKEFEFKMGADPEFILVSQNKQLSAESVFNATVKETKNLIKEGGEYVVAKNGERRGKFGQDGRSSTAELRPSPSYSPKELADNIGCLIEQVSLNTKIMKATTLSIFDPIGGHIHFGIQEDIIRNSEKLYSIHRILSSFFLPLMMSENKINLHLRVKGSYGKIGDYRQNNGDPNKPPTYEFRTPSAEWMTTRKIAEATLSYLGVVMHEILNNPKAFDNCQNIVYKTDKQGQALQLLTITDFHTITTKLFQEIKKKIKTFERYNDFKKEIDYIMDIKQVIKDKENAQYDLFMGWKTKETKKTKIEKLISEKDLQKKMLETDMEVYKEIVEVPFNSDINVNLFSEALSNRIMAYEYTPKYNYHLFGLRKGIEDYIATNFERNEMNFMLGHELVKTQKDFFCIEGVFDRMKRKFQSSITIADEDIFDLNDGKIKKTWTKNIAIGIPYEDRINKNVENFIKKIIEIEKKNEPIKIQLDSLPLINENGTISKTYEKGAEGEKKATITNKMPIINPENLTI